MKLLHKIRLVLLFFCTIYSYAQIKVGNGIPWIDTFSQKDLGNVGKISSISSAKNGILYFGTDEGILEYDGKNFNKYKNTFGNIISIHVANDSLIYTGSNNDFGVWKKNAIQEFTYQSLFSKIKNSKNDFEEFKHVFYVKNKAYFISRHSIYNENNDKVKKISTNLSISASFLINEKIYLTDENLGIYIFNGNEVKFLVKYPEGKNIQVLDIFQNKNEIQVITKNNGVFSIINNKLVEKESAISTIIKKVKLVSFSHLKNNYLAFGTLSDGLFITDSYGNILHHLSKKNGLNSNSIQNTFFDENSNIWINFQYALSSINLNNTINYFYDNNGDFGTANASILNGDTFFVGTNLGLFSTSWKSLNDKNAPHDFQLIPNSQGQVWSLENIDQQVFIGHLNGLFILKNNVLEKINDLQKVLCIKKLNVNTILVSNYNGVYCLKKINNQWKLYNKLMGISGTCNQIEIDGKDVWLNISKYGIIQLKINQKLIPTEKKIYLIKNFKSTQLNLSKNKKGILVTADFKSFVYNKTSQKFLFDNSIIKYQIKNALSENINPNTINSNFLFFPVYNGFALLNKNLEAKNIQKPKLVFRKLEVFNNQFKKFISLDQKIPYKFNNIRLSFIVPNSENVLYKYKLNNAKVWSKWTASNTLEFLNLKEGKYNFSIVAMQNGISSPEKKINFVIKPPFYRSILAYIFYLLGMILCIYLYSKYQKYILYKQKLKFLSDKKSSLYKQAKKFKQEQTILEKQNLELEKKSLELTLKEKTIELAKKAKEDDDKNRLLHVLKEKIEISQANPSLSKMKQKEINRLLENYFEEENDTFELQMDELHQEFLKKAAIKFPNLSIYDLRLCAYLKIGITSTEIAEILNVQLSSLYVSRSRLRKKMNLGPDEDLFQILNTI